MFSISYSLKFNYLLSFNRILKSCTSYLFYNVSGNSNRLIIDDISDDIQQEITQNGENLDPMWCLPLV